MQANPFRHYWMGGWPIVRAHFEKFVQPAPPKMLNDKNREYEPPDGETPLLPPRRASGARFHSLRLISSQIPR